MHILDISDLTVQCEILYAEGIEDFFTELLGVKKDNYLVMFEDNVYRQSEWENQVMFSYDESIYATMKFANKETFQAVVDEFEPSFDKKALGQYHRIRAEILGIRVL